MANKDCYCMKICDIYTIKKVLKHGAQTTNSMSSENFETRLNLLSYSIDRTASIYINCCTAFFFYMGWRQCGFKTQQN